MQQATRLRPVLTTPLLSRGLSNTSNIASQPASSAFFPSESQTFSLPDGRTLGFAEYGHPHGYPLFFFHGFPSSRIESYALDKLAYNVKFKIYSLERPGFGISTFQPGRRITDYPSDVLEFAKGKGINRFGIIGASGGGPYALACARYLPHEMMAGVSVFAGGPPWQAGKQYMQWWARWAHWLARNMPGTFTAISNGVSRAVWWLIGTQWLKKRVDKFLEGESKKKAERETPIPEDEFGFQSEGELTTAQRRERLLGLLWTEAFSQGTQAFVQELILLSDRGWGFDFEEVEYPVKIYHGVKDINAPIEMIRWMAQRLPNAILTEFEDTHFTIAGRLKQTMEELIPEEEKINYLEDKTNI